MDKNQIVRIKEEVLKASFNTEQFHAVQQTVVIGYMDLGKFMTKSFKPGLWALNVQIDPRSLDVGKYVDVNGTEFSFINGQVYHVLSFQQDVIYFQYVNGQVTNPILRKQIQSVENSGIEHHWFVMGSVAFPNKHEIVEAALWHLMEKEIEDDEPFRNYLDQLITLVMTDGATIVADHTQIDGVLNSEPLLLTGRLSAPNLHFSHGGDIPYADLIIRPQGMSRAQAEATAEMMAATVRFVAARHAMLTQNQESYSKIIADCEMIFAHRDHIVTTLMTS